MDDDDPPRPRLAPTTATKHSRRGSPFARRCWPPSGTATSWACATALRGPRLPLRPGLQRKQAEVRPGVLREHPPPAFPSSYSVGKNVRMNKEAAAVEDPARQVLRAPASRARRAAAARIARSPSARPSARAAMESSDDDDEEEEDNAVPAPAPAAQAEAAPPAEAEAARLADESEEATRGRGRRRGGGRRRRGPRARGHRGRPRGRGRLDRGGRAASAATEDEIRAAAPYAEGDQVEARFRGGVNWYPAVVVALVGTREAVLRGPEICRRFRSVR